RDLASHERFQAALEEEVHRARFFGRNLSVLFVKARGGDRAHVRFWLPQLQTLLRSIDRVGLYSQDALEILVPETARDDAARIAKRIVKALEEELGVSVGIATYPEPAFSAEALLGEARAAWQRTSASERVLAASERQRPTWTGQGDVAAPI